MWKVILLQIMLTLSWTTVHCQNSSHTCTTLILHNCDKNADCFYTNPGYTCTCKFGYSGNGTTCSAIQCLLSQAPKWPLSSATRIVAYVNGTHISSSAHGDVMPYKTYIEYSCPARFALVNSVTGEAHTTVIECVGLIQPTHQNNGWTGSEVRCDMKTEFMVAIVMAAVSSVIIVLVGGFFIVSWTGKSKKDTEDEMTLEMSDSVGNGSR